MCPFSLPFSYRKYPQIAISYYLTSPKFKQLMTFRCLQIILIRKNRTKPISIVSIKIRGRKHINRHYSVGGSIDSFAESYFMRYFISGKNRIKLRSCILAKSTNKHSLPYKVDRDLWRIHIKSKDSRSKVLTEGIDIHRINDNL